MKVMLLVGVLLKGALVSFSAQGESSTCYGTTSAGRLDSGVKLPAKGANFIGYSTILRIAGRTYVHSEVRNIIVETYRILETEQSGKNYKYGETGYQNGGLFKPHKTHQNGLSVDFFTPMIDEQGNSTHLPTHPFNKFGYNIEFEDNGNYGELVIDYDAMAAHIALLHKVSVENGFDLWRVIFDPPLQKKLFETQYGEYLRKNITFSNRRSWVRHDDHYHVDFEIPCR